MPKVNTRPPGRPITTGPGVQTLVRLHPPILDNLDAWIAAQPKPRPSRPEAIRVALRDWLASDAVLQALSESEAAKARKARAGGPGVRLRKAAK
jgi:Arc/MetJ-type ribon-helix-helix transcriptional regulator